MKKTGLILVIFTAILLSACNASLSETALQTAVSEAIMTSSAVEETSSDTTVAEQPAANMVSKEDFDNVSSSLAQAQVELTAQAEKINELQAELEQIYPLLTPTNTTEPPPPTNTPQATATPSPTDTPEGGLLFNQKYVVAVGSVPLYTYEKENDAGFPIMQKTDPILKFEAGAKIIVNIYPVRADGGSSFYLVIGPQHGGYYVLVDDVQDYTG